MSKPPLHEVLQTICAVGTLITFLIMFIHLTVHLTDPFLVVVFHASVTFMITRNWYRKECISLRKQVKLSGQEDT